MNREGDTTRQGMLHRLADRLDRERPTRSRSLQIILLLSILAWVPVILLLIWIF